MMDLEDGLSLSQELERKRRNLQQQTEAASQQFSIFETKIAATAAIFETKQVNVETLAASVKGKQKTLQELKTKITTLNISNSKMTSNKERINPEYARRLKQIEQHKSLIAKLQLDIDQAESASGR